MIEFIHGNYVLEIEFSYTIYTRTDTISYNLYNLHTGYIEVTH